MRIEKKDLVKMIVGLIVTAVCGIDLGLGLWGFFPGVLVAVAAGGLTSSRAEKSSFKTFLSGALPVLIGSGAMEVILLGA